jgi:hypothetical protein
LQIDGVENITDYLVGINSIVSGDIEPDSFASGTCQAYVTFDSTTLSHLDGEELMLPTSDFKNILEQYESFLNSPFKNS